MYILNRFVGILLVFNAITNCVLSQTDNGPYFISYQTPADCKETNGYAYFFNATQLRCVACTQNTTIQKVSADGLSCECNGRFFLTHNYGGWIECAQCPAGQVTAFNKWECVECSNSTTNPNCAQCSAQTRQITVQQQLNGSYSTQNPSQTCESCAPYTMPNTEGKQCFRCNQILSMMQNSSDCSCASVSGGLCFQSANDIIATSATVTYGTEPVVSAYFTENAAAATSMCGAKYGNSTACELLANLCTLSLYETTTTSDPTTCSQFTRLAGGQQWPPNMPWLYYVGGRNDLVLLDTGIPTQFSFPNGKLKFIVGTYSLNGTFLGFSNVTDGLLQLCRNSDDFLNAAYIFGTTYSQECEIPVRMFWDEAKYPLVLYDLWLEYETESGTKLYAIPIASGTTVLDPKSIEYQLYRRFFLVDNIIGKVATGGPAAGVASAIHYAKDIAIIIRLQDDQSSGLIYPPYVLINYVSAAIEDYEQNSVAKVTFQVKYYMSVSQYETGTAIAVGVLTGLSLLYAGLKTWSWSKRTGRITIDLMTLIKFLLLSCGYVANSLFAVALGAAIFWWILYKNQGTVVMLISSSNSLFVVYLAIGFTLKFIDVLHVVLSQSYINIFLIDWERPDSTHSMSKEHAEQRKRDRERPVSIWRTYFVANEWNELQTLRKINPTFQIISSVFFLSVVGFGNLATEDPNSNFQLDDPNKYYAPTSDIFRFGIFGMVYLIIALAQWLFFILLYDRCFENKMMEYIDFCSMNNISVFVLEDEFYGYYIHGRSVHGRADVGLREMHENFTREERDLCSKRGLIPETDQQTFQMALPRKLKWKYDRILMPVLAAQAQGGSAVAGAQLRKTGGGVGGVGVVDNSIALDPNVTMSIEAYGRINQLLQGFLDHTVKDVDYSVVEKSFLEQILDVEFKDPTEHGYFYKDNGHSFDRLFFFGNEMMLIVFEMLFFGLLDLGTKNYLFSGAMQYLLMEVLLKRFRDSMGKTNLARKTLVDKRFLI